MQVREFSGKKLAVALSVAVLLVVAAGTGVCAAAKQVAVFPFTMNSPQDLGFLQNGLFSMLSSRLADPGKVAVLDREAVDAALAKAKAAGLVDGTMTEDKARTIAAGMGVDYVLFGSLTHFGESVSLDAKMVDVTAQKPSLSFFEQSNSMGDVIPLVNSFAGDINEKVFNRRIDNQLYAQPVPQEAPAPGGLQHAGGAAVYGGGMMSMQAGQGFLTHLKLDDIIRALATGDVDGDGTVEVVVATDAELLIYSLEGTMLKQEKKLEYKDYLRIVGLDVADINGNGTPEIFVSAMTIHRESLDSFVVEYNGSAYATLVEGESLYYRVVDTGHGNKVLMGQEKGRDPFSGKIHLMSARGGEYIEAKGVRMPRGTSVMSLAKGPVTGDTYEEYLGINEHQRLVAIDSSGSQAWESTEKYGGTNNYWLMPLKDTDSTYRDHVYLSPRVKFYAMEEGGKPQAFVVKNQEIGGGVFGRYKRFKEGYIEVLAWNGIAMGPVFQTMPVQGWICDYDIADIDGDGSPELVTGVVSRTKLAILSKDKSSNIISYKLK